MKQTLVLQCIPLLGLILENTMAADSEPTVARGGRTTRIVYLAALFFFIEPYVSNGYRSLGAMRIATSTSSVERLASSYLLVLYAAVIFLVLLRAFWVIAGKTQLESPSSSTAANALRNTGIAFMYFGVIGYLSSLGFLVITSAPAIFAIFTLPLKTMIPYGLLFFESGRILAYENRPNPLEPTR